MKLSTRDSAATIAKLHRFHIFMVCGNLTNTSNFPYFSMVLSIKVSLSVLLLISPGTIST